MRAATRAPAASTVSASESVKALLPTGRRAGFYTKFKNGFHNGKSDYSVDRRQASPCRPSNSRVFRRTTATSRCSRAGAALYFLRPPAKVEVINDINGELINLYRVGELFCNSMAALMPRRAKARRERGFLRATKSLQQGEGALLDKPRAYHSIP